MKQAPVDDVRKTRSDVDDVSACSRCLCVDVASLSLYPGTQQLK